MRKEGLGFAQPGFATRISRELLLADESVEKGELQLQCCLNYRPQQDELFLSLVVHRASFVATASDDGTARIWKLCSTDLCRLSADNLVVQLSAA